MNTRRRMARRRVVVPPRARGVDKPEAHSVGKGGLAKHDRTPRSSSSRTRCKRIPTRRGLLLLGKTLLDRRRRRRKRSGKARELKAPTRRSCRSRERCCCKTTKKARPTGKVELETPEARAELAAMLGQAYMLTGNAEAARRLFEDAEGVPAWHDAGQRADAGAGTDGGDEGHRRRSRQVAGLVEVGNSKAMSPASWGA